MIDIWNIFLFAFKLIAYTIVLLMLISSITAIILIIDEAIKENKTGKEDQKPTRGW